MLEPALMRMLKMPESGADGACLGGGASSVGPSLSGALASHKNPTDWSKHVIASFQVTRLPVTYVQLRPDVGGWRRTRLDGLDGSARAHNPKVGGSNPPPATIAIAGQGRCDSTGPLR